MTNSLRIIALATTTLLPTVALADFNGAYAGLSFGPNVKNELTASGGGVSASVDADDSNAIGVFAGYQVQNGDVVYGGELAIANSSDVTFDFGDGDEATGDIRTVDIKGRAGYVFGDIMAYGVLGFSQITSDDNDDDNATGFNFGVGAEYVVADNIVIGAEYLARRTSFDEDDDGFELDYDLDTFAIRASYQF